MRQRKADYDRTARCSKNSFRNATVKNQARLHLEYAIKEDKKSSSLKAVASKDFTAPPTILLQFALNALPGRQAFTCAHELGHAFFNHGTRADLISDFERDRSDDPEEIIADAFAGHLLMPPHAVESEINRRAWKASNLTPVQVYGFLPIRSRLRCAGHPFMLCPQPDQQRAGAGA